MNSFGVSSDFRLAWDRLSRERSTRTDAILLQHRLSCRARGTTHYIPVNAHLATYQGPGSGIDFVIGAQTIGNE